MRRFRAILAQDNTETNEGWLTRRFPAGAFTWESGELPLTLRAVWEDTGGHMGAFPIGAIERLERADDFVVGTGFLDDEGVGDLGDQARHMIHLIESGVMNGLSVDPGNGGIDVEEECTETDDEGWCTAVVVTFNRYSIGAATLVATPALQGTLIELLDDEPADEATAARQALDSVSAAAVVAAVAARSTLGPAEWFEPVPEDMGYLPRPIITDEGRVFAYVAALDDCHLSFPMDGGACQQPWLSACGYCEFHAVDKLVDGPDGPVHLEVGAVAVSGGHFSTEGDNARNWRAAQAHYDDPSTVTVYGRSGHNALGIWIAGAVAPQATEDMIEAFRSHRLSGDWRRIHGNMELVGACSVVVHGFRRREVVTASGELVAAMVASGAPRLRPAEPAAVAASACGCGGHTASAAAPTAEVAAMRRELDLVLRHLTPSVREAIRAHS